MALEVRTKEDGTKEVVDVISVETVTRKNRKELRALLVDLRFGKDTIQAEIDKVVAVLRDSKALFDEAEGLEA
jgi:PIN domain nuclease of toxin-antitoxin system